MQQNENKFKIVNISLTHFLKDIERVVNIDMKEIRRTISLPYSLYLLIIEHENMSFFISNVANAFYNKIKHIKYYYRYFSDFIRNAFIDFLITSNKIKEIIEKNDNIVYIEGKKHVVKKLINPN